jgi:SAM-dependent methyltransferase
MKVIKMNEKNHSLYEKFTKIYEVLFKPFFIGGIKRVMNILEKKKHTNVLEAGCGTGYSFEYYPSGFNVTAYDVSNAMVDEARKKSKEILDNDIMVLDADNYHSYLKGKTFDAVISFSVMSVVPDPQVFLEELRMRCKRGGCIYLVMHQRSKGLKKIPEYIFEFPCRFLFGFTLLRHIEDMDISGLEIIENRSINKFMFFTLNNLIVLKKHI